MGPFEFVRAFYLVVLGVGVAQILTSVGRLVELRCQVRINQNRRVHAGPLSVF